MNNNLQYLVEKEFNEKIASLYIQIMELNQEKEALELIKVFNIVFKSNPEFRNIYPDYYRRFEAMIYKLMFIALPLIKEDELTDLFKNYFLNIFSIQFYNIKKKLSDWFKNTPDLKERDNIKLKLREALINNNQDITKNNIKINNKFIKPTIGNWLKNYNSKLGTQKIDKLKIVQYLAVGENTEKLSVDEKEKLKFILNFYEYLKISSTTPQGLSESFIAILPNKEIAIISEGEIETIPQQVKNILEKIKNKPSNIEYLRELLNKYPINSIERKAIEEEIKKIEG